MFKMVDVTNHIVTVVAGVSAIFEVEGSDAFSETDDSLPLGLTLKHEALGIDLMVEGIAKHEQEDRVRLWAAIARAQRRKKRPPHKRNLSSEADLLVQDSYEGNVTSIQEEMDFKSKFRFNRSTVKYLIDKYEADTAPPATTGRPRTATEITVLMSLWTLSTSECFRSIANRFDLGIGNAHRSFVTFCKQLEQLQAEYVVWPDKSTARRISNEFSDLHEEGSGFPGVVGCLDAAHILIRPPKRETELYFNQKRRHSVVLQGVCDSGLRFTNVFVGCPGSLAKASVWKQSFLGRRLAADAGNFMLQDTYLLGTDSYPLHPYLLVPYRDDGSLTDDQRAFTEKLNATGAVIRQAFAQLRGRFRRLKYIDMFRMDLICTVITACCVLHNICIGFDDESPEADDSDNEDVPDNGTDEGDVLTSDELGRAKRDQLCNEFARASNPVSVGPELLTMNHFTDSIVIGLL